MPDKKEKKKKDKKREANKNRVANLILIAGLFFAIGFFISQQSLLKKDNQNNITINEAQEKVLDFVHNNLVQEGVEVQVVEASEDRGLYKIVLSVQEQEITSYVTKDGADFFPTSMNINEINEESEAAAAASAPKDIPKEDKPVVEAFVMSYCPYGTQIQKGLIPVVDLLKDSIDFDFKFVDYAMHEKQEIDENLVQYCINKEEKSKYNDYLGCFLSSGDSAACMVTAQIDQTKNKKCVTDTDNQFGVTKSYNDKSTWRGQFPPFDVQREDNQKYGVQGSPTLIINGVETTSARDPQSLLTTICGSFNEAPPECNQELSSETPAPGFGDGTTSNSAAADCVQ